MQRVDVGELVLLSIAKPAEKPMNEPKVATYSQHISQLCLRLKITAWSRNEALASAMSFIPNQAATDTTAMNGTQIQPAFCSHRRPPSPSCCGSPPKAPNRPPATASGTANCITETPRLPSPAFRPRAVPCWLFG